ncbi:RDD family protein [Kibdelosporangium persicum]|uniref:RDD domain-containing protein n=1 Tax=Kibdelosporangium persicum TaxID=2698649 RepID=A0ABX2F636_9PSEU|nr:RDD family protein [Kibdelosporangium persicum]NRN66805.1 RDD domain-containing protein [Kibdelosporangium persicum]
MLGRHRLDVRTAEAGGRGEVALATPGGRIAARLVDVLIVFLPVYVVLSVVSPDNLLAVIGTVVLGMVPYDTLLTMRTGATPGKRIARVRVVRTDTGAPPGLSRAFVRAVLGVPLSLVPAVTALFDERTHRGWHDRVAGTLVIAE